jgi:hypothetical protein
LEVRQAADTARPVNVVVPAWFGMADRHHVAKYLDPDAARPLMFVSSTLAGVYGHHLGTADESSIRTVLSLDLRRGWSAGLITVESSGLTEVACWGVPPHRATGRIDDVISSRWLVDHVLAAASTVPGIPAISGVLVIDEDGIAANRVRRALMEHDGGSSECPAFAKRGRRLVPKGIASMRGESDGGVPSVGSLHRALAVLADDDPEQPAMHVVAAEHANFPSATRLPFDLGPDDGSPLHFDVFEQEHRSVGGDPVRGRLVVRAHFVRERGYDRSIVVTFELGANGLFKIGPAAAWRLDWAPPSVDLD